MRVPIAGRAIEDDARCPLTGQPAQEVAGRHRTRIGVAAVISALVILLTMYTTVTERTRQIGIMKSLGMSNGAIAWTITKEALLLSFLGIVGGVVLTVALRFVLTKFTTLTVEISPTVLGIVFVVGLIGGAIGALYPALRAARLDAVEALSYE